MNTRGQHFYMEAERLWKAEEGKATLTNIQGVALMCCVCVTPCKDNLAHGLVRG
jgi:hypothetical protein